MRRRRTRLSQTRPLAKLPKLAGAKLPTETPTMSFYQCETDVKTFDAHFRSQLGKLGWKEDRATDMDTTFFSYIKSDLRSGVRAWQMPGTDLTQVNIYFADDEDGAAAKAAPRLPGAQEICATKSNITYTLAKPAADTIEAARKELTAAGWTVEPSTTSKTHVIYFHKGGMNLYVALNQLPGSGSVSVQIMGNVDVRPLPKLKEMPAFSYHKGMDSPQIAYYRAEAPVKDVVAFATKELTARGWKPFAPIQKTKSSQVRKQFRQNGMTIDVVAEAMEDKNTVVYYTTGMFPFDLPILDDADDIRIEGYAGHAVYATKLTIDGAVEELGKKLTSNGWKMDDKLSVIGKREHKRVWTNPISANPLVVNVAKIGNTVYVETRTVEKAQLQDEFSKPSNKGDEE